MAPSRQASVSGSNFMSTANRIDANEMLRHTLWSGWNSIITCQGLTSGVMAVLECILALRNEHSGGTSDFRRLHLSTYSRTSGALEAEQWPVEMENLLKVARVMDRDKTYFIQIKLTGIPNT